MRSHECFMIMYRHPFAKKKIWERTVQKWNQWRKNILCTKHTHAPIHCLYETGTWPKYWVQPINYSTHIAKKSWTFARVSLSMYLCKCSYGQYLYVMDTMRRCHNVHRTWMPFLLFLLALCIIMIARVAPYYNTRERIYKKKEKKTVNTTITNCPQTVCGDFNINEIGLSTWRSSVFSIWCNRRRSSVDFLQLAFAYLHFSFWVERVTETQIQESIARVTAFFF